MSEKWHHSEIHIAIIDESQGNIANNLRCDEYFFTVYLSFTLLVKKI